LPNIFDEVENYFSAGKKFLKKHFSKKELFLESRKKHCLKKQAKKNKPIV